MLCCENYRIREGRTWSQEPTRIKYETETVRSIFCKRDLKDNRMGVVLELTELCIFPFAVIGVPNVTEDYEDSKWHFNCMYILRNRIVILFFNLIE